LRKRILQRGPTQARNRIIDKKSYNGSLSLASSVGIEMNKNSRGHKIGQLNLRFLRLIISEFIDENNFGGKSFLKSKIAAISQEIFIRRELKKIYFYFEK